MTDLLNLVNFVKDLKFRVFAEGLDVLSVIDDRSIDCCLVLYFYIFWDGVFSLSLFGP